MTMRSPRFPRMFLLLLGCPKSRLGFAGLRAYRVQGLGLINVHRVLGCDPHNEVSTLALIFNPELRKGKTNVL